VYLIIMTANSEKRNKRKNKKKERKKHPYKKGGKFRTGNISKGK